MPPRWTTTGLRVLALLTCLLLGRASPSEAGPADPLPVAADDLTRGPRVAPVELIWFSDLECPYCSRVRGTVDQLEKKYGRKLRVVFKHFPLPFHKKALPAAEVTVLVKQRHGDAAAWRFVETAYAERGADVGQWLTKAGLSPALAQQRGPATEKRVQQDVDLGKATGVRGTPAFFINGRFVSGARPQAAFETMIDEELAAVAKLQRQGLTLARAQAQREREGFVKPAPKKPTKPAQDSTTVWKVPVRGDEPVRGPRHALVTIIELAEFQCPFCKKVQPTLEEVRRRYPKEVRIVFKHNPLPFHKRADEAAQLSLEALKRQGNRGFWKAHDALFAAQPNLNDADLQGIAQQLGLNPSATMAAVAREAHAATIETDQAEASDFNASGTPHFFINGRRLVGAQPVARFVELIDEEIAKAKALRARGVPMRQLYDRLVAKGKGPPPLEKKKVPAPGRHTPIRGSANAKVTIHAFLDFQCPFCSRVQDTLEQIVQRYGSKVRIAFRHKPLPFHKDAQLAHEAAQEAFRQRGDAGFWSMHDRLFEGQRSLKRSDLEAYATAEGLDLGAFRRALDQRSHRAIVEKDTEMSNNAGIRGTPGFVINGYFLSGAQPFAKFRKLIDKALKEAP